MTEPYDPAKYLARLIENWKNGREFAHAGEQTIANAIMASKGITLLAQTTNFNEDIRERRQQTTNLNTWATFKNFFIKITINKGERSPPQAKGGTQRQ